MFKKMLIVGFGALLATTFIGCDEELLSSMSPETSKMFMESQGVQAGDLLMGRLQLQDGSGENCTDPDDPGSCDGLGPYGTGGYGDNGGGNGTGTDGGDRLRDGSCGS